MLGSQLLLTLFDIVLKFLDALTSAREFLLELQDAALSQGKIPASSVSLLNCSLLGTSRVRLRCKSLSKTHPIRKGARLKRFFGSGDGSPHVSEAQRQLRAPERHGSRRHSSIGRDARQFGGVVERHERERSRNKVLQQT